MLGAAWMSGALSCWPRGSRWDPRRPRWSSAPSAGSVLAALLGPERQRRTSGASADRQTRLRPSGRGRFRLRDSSGGALPERPRLGVGSRHLLAHSARTPAQCTTAVFAACLPVGRSSLSASLSGRRPPSRVGMATYDVARAGVADSQLVGGDVVGDADASWGDVVSGGSADGRASRHRCDGGYRCFRAVPWSRWRWLVRGWEVSLPWSPHPGLRIVHLDYDSGRRVAFGRA